MKEMQKQKRVHLTCWPKQTGPLKRVKPMEARDPDKPAKDTEAAEALDETDAIAIEALDAAAAEILDAEAMAAETLAEA